MPCPVKDYLRAGEWSKAQETAFQILSEVATEPVPVFANAQGYTRRQNAVGKFLYLPVEVGARDMAPRAWLAGKMVRKGWKVLLGSAWGIGVHKWADLPAGVVLLKSTNALDAKLAVEANHAGHLVAILSEELFGLAPEEWLYRAEISPQALEVADLICAQGEPSAAILRRLVDPAKVVVTGHPRAMMLQRERVGGDKIVLCTMGGTVNGQKPFAEYARMMVKVLGKPLEGDLARLLHEQVEHEIRALPLVLDAGYKLREVYGDRLIVRPHPVEDKATFGWPDDPVPFTERLKTAACVVFVGGCGTGLEATMAGVQCVRLGDGGHGISRELGFANWHECDMLDIVRFAIDYQGAPPSTCNTFAPTTLPAVLDDLQRRHSANVKGDIVTSIMARPYQWMPSDFETNKFPPLETVDAARYASVPLRRVGWNMWTG